jgi:hypothetical protein
LSGELVLQARGHFPLRRTGEIVGHPDVRAAIERALPRPNLTQLGDEIAVGVGPGAHLGVLAQRVELVDQVRALPLGETG